jgi:polyhydroxyalkanoate synthase subunit PhaC
LTGSFTDDPDKGREEAQVAESSTDPPTSKDASDEPPRPAGDQAPPVPGPQGATNESGSRNRRPPTNGDGGDHGAEASAEDEAWASDRGAPAVNLAILAAAHKLARRPPFRDGLTVAQRLLRSPRLGAAPLAGLGAELKQIARGRSDLAPWQDDRRYADGAWKTNPLLRGTAQAHAALTQAVDDVLDRTVDDAGTRYRLGLAVDNCFQALSPPNFLLLNPAALKAAVDTGGSSLMRGVGRFLRDMSAPPRLPVRAEPDAYRIGIDVATTPGQVIARTELMEVIQYASPGPKVRDQPLLIVPSVVNKYYLTDLSPGRSLAAHAIAAGHEVFSISWVNPDVEHRHCGLDAYIASIEEALDLVEDVTGSARPHVLGVCAGGQLATIAAAHLAATGKPDRVGSLTLLVSVLDHESDSMPGGFVSPETEELALQAVDRRGYVDGRDLTSALAWLRSVDSVWWPFTHRYLIGADMPKLDLFYWSEDVSNVTAKLVRDMAKLTADNRLTHPGSQIVLGVPIDLRDVTVDAYVVAGLTDHLTPWHECYRTTQMLGSKCRFVLVLGGHIQAIIRPPHGRSAGFRTSGRTPKDPARWLESASSSDESWWDHWLAWLARRSPGSRPAPVELGSAANPPIEPAPGSYVRRRLDGH